MTTRKQISAGIKAATGFDIKVHGSPGIGCYHFYSDDQKTALMLAKFYGTTVYVNTLGQLPVDRWVSEFQDMLDLHLRCD